MDRKERLELIRSIARRRGIYDKYRRKYEGVLRQLDKCRSLEDLDEIDDRAQHGDDGDT